LALQQLNINSLGPFSMQYKMYTAVLLLRNYLLCNMLAKSFLKYFKGILKVFIITIGPVFICYID